MPPAELQKFASPIGLSRDPHWDDAWTDKRTNQYVLPHPDNHYEQLRAGRASELGKTISNTFTLNRWHKEMMLRGLVIRKSLILRAAIAIAELAKPSSVLWDIGQEAEDVAGSKEPAAKGTGFHKMTELYDQGKIGMDEAPEPWDRDLLAYATLLADTGIACVPEYTERIVWNRPLNIAGRFDRLWRYERCCEKWHVGDLKTGRYLDAGWHEIPIQLDCYAGATYLFDIDTEKWSEMPETCRRIGLVLHVPSDGKKYVKGDIMADGEPATGGELTGNRMAALFEVKLDKKIPIDRLVISPAELALAVQLWQKTKKIEKMVYRVEITSDGEVIDSPLTIAERIELTESKEELELLWAETKARKEWRGHHTIKARERLEILAS